MGVCCSAVHTELEKLAAFKITDKKMDENDKRKPDQVMEHRRVLWYSLRFISDDKAEYKVHITLCWADL